VCRTLEIVIQLETPSLTNVLDPCLPMWTGCMSPSIVSPDAGEPSALIPNYLRDNHLLTA